MKYRHILGAAIAVTVLAAWCVVYMFVNFLYTGKCWPQ